MHGVQHHGDFAVSAFGEHLHDLVGLLPVIDGHGRIGVRGKGAEAVGVGTADKGDLQRRDQLRRIVEAAAQQDQAPKPFGAGQLGACPQLVLAGADLVQDHGIAGAADGFLDGADNAGEEGVAYAAYHPTDGVGRGLYQIAGAVIGDVMQLAHHRQAT